MGDILDPWIAYLIEKQKSDYGPDWDIPPWAVPRETEEKEESQ